MDQIYVLSADEVLKAQQFHLQHFPNQDVPAIRPMETDTTEPSTGVPSDDLGLYPDGTRRALTDKQIALFRHSEIQRLLAQRRRKEEAQESRRWEKAERSHTKPRQRQSEGPVPPRYQSDTMVHANEDVTELSYEESQEIAKDQTLQKFKWPFLGP